jgi:hypothetical protein
MKSARSVILRLDRRIHNWDIFSECSTPAVKEEPSQQSTVCSGQKISPYTKYQTNTIFQFSIHKTGVVLIIRILVLEWVCILLFMICII